MLAALFVMTMAVHTQGLQFATEVLDGSWIGTLEYRDYSDDSREKLATLLRVYPDKEARGSVFRYVYDDGPTKVVQDQDLVILNPQTATYSVCSMDLKSREEYYVTGLKELKPDGTGTLTLLGKGSENNVAVDIRETITIQRNRFTVLRESRIRGKDYLFRHKYEFTRVSKTKSG